MTLAEAKEIVWTTLKNNHMELREMRRLAKSSDDARYIRLRKQTTALNVVLKELGPGKQT